MICLGIESTAHTAGIGIVNEKGEVLANEKDTFTTEEGGMIPRELAEHHAEKFPTVLKNAFEKANLKWKDIDIISYSAGPGMGPALSVGATLARLLALLHNKPLVAVNHCVAHIEIGKEKTGCKDPLVVYASGGNSQIIGYETGKYRVYGETLDIGIGNLLDSFGRQMGLGFPAGPIIDKMYSEAKNYIELPYSVKGMDLNFSGLLTSAKQKIGKVDEKDLAYSLMHTGFAMLTEVTERALAHTEKKEVLLVGGVAASKALQKMINEMCKERGVKMFVCPTPLAVDNGAMISWTGILMFKAGRKTEIEKATTNQKFRTDLEEINWV
ncbi:MAG: KEOPS complex N(6)-L-threonylcarbamoyladenine synthase Kae1 [archaeon]|nr:KEOPS complex N(6)-L-threonylcarbamoyladenine synthase Kae1 [archaeon]